MSADAEKPTNASADRAGEHSTGEARGPDELRNRALARLRQGHRQEMRDGKPASDLLEELQIHQIELEMQNEELRSARHGLERALQRYDDLFNNAPVGYVQADADGRMTEVNRTLARWLGREANELMTAEVNALAADEIEDQDAWFLHWRKLEAGEATASCEVRLKTADGGVLPVSVDSRAIRDAKGIFQGCRCAFSDISSRREAEAQRKTAEERTASLARFPHENPLPVLRVSKDGFLIYANRGSEALLREWHITEGDMVPEMLLAVLRKSLQSHAVEELEVDAREHTYRLFITPIEDAGYANIYGHDITELRRIQEQEKEEAARGAAERTAIQTIDAMGEGVALCDTDGRIRNVNPAFAVLAEHDRSELAGRNIRDVLPDMFDQVDREVKDTLAEIRLKKDKRLLTHALTITTSKGARKWIAPTLTAIRGAQDKALGIVLTLRDISELMRAQIKSSESERKYRELVENANSAIIRITPDYRITFFNEYAQHLFGYSSDEVIGKNMIGTIMPEIDSEGRDLRKLTQKIAAHTEFYGSVEHENICRDRTRLWCHWSNRAIRDRQGRVAEILCIGTDVTERKQLEQEADTYRQRLRNLADKLIATEEEERRRIATHIHDTVIQTLSLSNIRLGGVHAAVKKAGLTAEFDRLGGIRALLDEGIRECRGLMEELVPSMLYEVGLPAALKDFAEDQSRIDKTPITVVLEGQPEPLNDALRGLLFQCTRELVMNALKYAGPCRIRISISDDDGWYRVEVQDDGHGFDPASKDLFSVDEEGGFGLFNIRERLRGLGGELDIESAPGKGTTATVRVPIGERGQS